ncbi:MAG: gamma-glutamyltranspeptidase / glutathione hydrolase [Actinomycetota bacterium]|nr:gamma-glutamyltranspeptidase / glutathione hydrolase [Actinomycetota bacterium]
MGSPRLAIAAGNQLSADAAAEIGAAGGNAVDACLASAIMAWVAEPFMASLGGSGFIIVRTGNGRTDVFDGNNAMPLGVGPDAKLTRIFVPDYANGLHTGIGGGAVAVPGIVAAIEAAWQAHGQVEWPALFGPAIAAARDGIRFPRTSAYYLSVTWTRIWSQYAISNRLFGNEQGPLKEGHPFVQAELADALQLIASDGAKAIYGGPLGEGLVNAVQEDGGALSIEDLVRYSAERRDPISTPAFGWTVEANPPPAVGGAVLVHMLSLLEGANLSDPVARLRAVVDAEGAAIGYRSERYEDPGEVAGALQQALEQLRSTRARSGSTSHMSTADADGQVCAVTESNGYGSGLIAQGVLLNNTLGEEELNPRGAFGMTPGSRCHSNMTPTVASGPDLCVALGSPGADRIVGAIAQTLIALAVDGVSLAEAVARPRAHVQHRPDGPVLCFEPGLPAEELGLPLDAYSEPHMFFGGVQAASVDSAGTVDAAHDPRRSGATAFV